MRIVRFRDLQEKGVCGSRASLFACAEMTRPFRVRSKSAAASDGLKMRLTRGWRPDRVSPGAIRRRWSNTTSALHACLTWSLYPEKSPAAEASGAKRVFQIKHSGR